MLLEVGLIATASAACWSAHEATLTSLWFSCQLRLGLLGRGWLLWVSQVEILRRETSLTGSHQKLRCTFGKTSQLTLALKISALVEVTTNRSVLSTLLLAHLSRYCLELLDTARCLASQFPKSWQLGQRRYAGLSLLQRRHSDTPGLPVVRGGPAKSSSSSPAHAFGKRGALFSDPHRGEETQRPASHNKRD